MKTPKNQTTAFVVTRGGIENALMRLGITDQADLNAYVREIQSEADTSLSAVPTKAAKAVVDYMEAEEGDHFYSDDDFDDNGSDHIFRSVVQIKAAVDPEGLRAELKSYEAAVKADDEARDRRMVSVIKDALDIVGVAADKPTFKRAPEDVAVNTIVRRATKSIVGQYLDMTQQADGTFRVAAIDKFARFPEQPAVTITAFVSEGRAGFLSGSTRYGMTQAEAEREIASLRDAVKPTAPSKPTPKATGLDR